MRQALRILLIIPLSLVAVGLVVAQVTKNTVLPQTSDPVINFHIPLSKTSQVIYAIRYSQVLDAKTANELADFLVAQANDTTLNKPLVSTIAPHKQK